MKRVIDVSEALYNTCKRLVSEGDPRPSESCIANSEPYEPQGEWIPVSERLPDDRKSTYWVCTDGEYQCQCRWTNVNSFWAGLKTDWHWCLFDIPQYQEVIAWQPLPESYKEGGKEK